MGDIGYLVGFAGILGAVLLLMAWIPQTLRTIRTKRTGMEPRFLYIYLLGSFLLTAYAFLISDFVFFVLNAAATLSAGINAFYHHKYESKGAKQASHSSRQRRR